MLVYIHIYGWAWKLGHGMWWGRQEGTQCSSTWELLIGGRADSGDTEDTADVVHAFDGGPRHRTLSSATCLGPRPGVTQFNRSGSVPAIFLPCFDFFFSFPTQSFFIGGVNLKARSRF